MDRLQTAGRADGTNPTGRKALVALLFAFLALCLGSAGQAQATAPGPQKQALETQPSPSLSNRTSEAKAAVKKQPASAKTAARPASRNAGKVAGQSSGKTSAKPAAKAKTAHQPPCLLQLGKGELGRLKCYPQDQLEAVFQKTDKAMAQLKANKTRSSWRQPWEDLRAEYLSVYKSNTSSPLAPRALFKAGECQRHLAASSRLGEDWRMSGRFFLAVADEYPRSSLAPTALLEAAQIAQSGLRDNTLASKLAARLARGYPQSQAARKAQRLLKQTGQASAKAPGAKAELETLSWDSISRDQVEIVLDFSAPARTKATLAQQKEGSAVVAVDIKDAGVVSEIRRGLAVKGSLLKAVRVQTVAKDRTRVLFEFSKVRHFSAKSEKHGARLVLSVDASPKAPAGATRGLADRSAAGRLAYMASTEGKAIATVAIDAGHGGKDPGTVHNGVREEDVTLDVALRLGRLLQDNGFRVVYTRKSDIFIPLPSRSRRANENRADIFVSIHVNAHDAPEARGFETYYRDEAVNGAALLAARENGENPRAQRAPRIQRAALTGRVVESRNLAVDIQRSALSRLRRSGYRVISNGVKSGPFFVLGTTQMPAILAEIGYCTNVQEALLLADPAYRQAIAEGLAEGVLAYRDRRISRISAERSPRATARRAVR